MPTLIFYGIVLAIIGAGYGAWHHSVHSEGEAAGIAAQVAADKPIVAKLTLDRDSAVASEKAREGETAACKAGADAQNAAIDKATDAARQAQARANDAERKLAATRAATQIVIENLRADASKASTGGKNETCDAANAVAVDALRRLRQ